MLQGTETILLAEDETLVRNVVATILREQGYTVLEVENGQDALQVAKEHSTKKIHLLLTDILMPKMNGLDLACAFKNMFPDTKILLMSGYTGEPDLSKFTSGTNVEFLPKPCSKDL